MVNSLTAGSSVVTSGGIVGKVVKLNDESFITVNISDGVDVKIKRDTIVELLENSKQKN
jgi:preprotein translocase subunit YajC